jgi:hypothetical protein
LATPAICAERPTQPLGNAPLCEASALQRLPGEASRWLVADNEIHDRLFLFERTDRGLRVAAASPTLPLDGQGRPRDIEALALVEQDLFVVGSHSRGRSCEAGDKRKRRHILRTRPAKGHLETIARVSGREAIDALQRSGATVVDCLAALFVVPHPTLARETCEALLGAERRASAERCETFNIEGAVGVGEPGRLWLGLRSPLVGGRAALLRLADGASELRFDAVSLIDLGGLGIRALAQAGGHLYGVAGDTVDSSRSQLWVGELPVPGRRLPAARVLEALPAGAEGLSPARSGAEAVAVTDGQDPGEDPSRCRKPAGQLTVPLALP